MVKLKGFLVGSLDMMLELVVFCEMVGQENEIETAVL
jgi:hypothetical protein